MPTLTSRLEASRAMLGKIGTALNERGANLRGAVSDTYFDFVANGDQISPLLQLIEARTEARKLLAGLEHRADANHAVEHGTARSHFRNVRLLGILAYVTANWSLADVIAGFAGNVLCTSTASKYRGNPPQLVKDFVNAQKATVPAVFAPVRQRFGWPAAVSYAIRNLFVHDGGLHFFEGQTPELGFRISERGWRAVVEKASGSGVEDYCCRDGVTLPRSTAPDDLRQVLDVCEVEVDEALGVILVTACQVLRVQVGFAIGEDP